MRPVPSLSQQQEGVVRCCAGKIKHSAFSSIQDCRVRRFDRACPGRATTGQLHAASPPSERPSDTMTISPAACRAATMPSLVSSRILAVEADCGGFRSASAAVWRHVGGQGCLSDGSQTKLLPSSAEPPKVAGPIHHYDCNIDDRMSFWIGRAGYRKKTGRRRP